MKIKYEFINGEKTEIEVDESLGTFILDSRRIEENLARKERYHCYSSDAAWEGEDYADPNTPETEMLRKEFSKEMADVISELTEVQQRRLFKYLEGKSMRAIAREEGVQHKAVVDSFNYIKKVLKKFL